VFPGANETDGTEEASYGIVGAPLDVSTTFQPGTRFGPERVRRFAETFDDYDHGTNQRFSELSVVDHGDVRAWDDAVEYLHHLEGELRDVVIDDAVPLVIGGEHTVSEAAVRATDPDLFVCLDAHLDLRSEYDGNPHSHACVTRHVLDVADEAVILGTRTGSEEEWERASVDDVTVVPPEDVRGWIEAVGSSGSDPFDGRETYLSVDIDGADPGFAPGTGTKEPFGLHPREMRDVVRLAAPHCIGFDVVEVNDRDDGQAAALAGKLLREFVYEHARADRTERQR